MSRDSIQVMRLLSACVVLGLLTASCAGGTSREEDTGLASQPVPSTSAQEESDQLGEEGPDETGGESDPAVVTVDLPDPSAAEPLSDIDGWLQTNITSLEDLRGKVVVVQFWTFGCINCKNTLANLRSLYAEYQGEDFEVVGVHSPEFDYEKDPVAIAAAAVDLGVTWPIALDTRKRTFFKWQGSPAYWPRTYVLDREGRIRFDHIGEGAYEDLNDAVAALLG